MRSRGGCAGDAWVSTDPRSPCAPAAGIDGFGYEDRRKVQQSFQDLRLERPAAREVLAEVARK